MDRRDFLHAVAAGTPAVAAGASAEGSEDKPMILPTPMQMAARPGAFVLTDRTVIAPAGKPSELAAVAERLAASLRKPTALALPVQAGDAPAGGLALGLAKLPELGAEGYRLDMSPKGVRLQANTARGGFYGGVTLRQRLAPQIDSATPVAGGAWTAPCVTVADRPRYCWRGLMLESGRQDRCLVAGTKAGHEVLASPNDYTYLNFPEKPWRRYQANRTFDLRKACEAKAVELAAALPAGQRSCVLGIRPCLWTDFNLTQPLLPGRLFWRLLTITELAWHVGQRPSFAAFARKVEAIRPRLEAMGIPAGRPPGV